MTTPITTDEFVALTERSGLLPADKLNSLLDRARSSDGSLLSSETLARQLVRERLLTPFQARQLLRGRYRGFFLTEKYKILELLGEGGMGRVLLCEHLMLHKLVAVKLLQMSGASMPGATERFLREARAAAALDHPNIARVFDVDKAGATPFMVMEYVDGTNLHQLVADHGPLSVERAAEYVRQAALGLQHAHEHGLIHRDIKPGNLILDRNGTVKMLDLGLARFFDSAKNENLTQKFDEKSILGTADFISPEQAMNSSKVDIRADIYSLGCTMYYLLLRRFPFDEGSVTQKLLWHQTKNAPAISDFRSDVPDELIEVIEKMMAKKPDERYQTPAETVAALAPFAGKSLPAPPPHEMPKVKPSTYQLGISSPPSAAVLGLSGADSVTPSPNGADQPTGINTNRRPGGSTAGNTPPVYSHGTGGHPALPSGPWQGGSSGFRQPGIAGTPQGGTPMPSFDPTAPASFPHIPPQLLSQLTAAELSGLMQTQRLTPETKSRTGLWVGLGLGGLALIAVGVIAFLMLGRGNGTAQPTDTKPTPATTPTTEPDPGPGVAPNGIVLNGAGSSFVDPLMQKWAEVYLKKTGTKISYQPLGSGRGIDGVTEKLLDFGCSDAPMSDDQLAKAKSTHSQIVHIPLAMGAVVPTYNVPGLTEQLKFTGPILAQIFMGKITKWDDEAIKALNPDAGLPNLPIVVVHRKDKSGTSYIWTEYLGKVYPDFKTTIPKSTAPKWPKGQSEGEGNNGVAEVVTRTNGAIGYNELSYAVTNGLRYGRIKNKEGRFPSPTFESVTASAAGVLKDDFPNDLRFSLTDPSGANSYPVSGTVWAMVYINPPRGNGKEIAEFLWWITHEGQAYCNGLKYAPLPEELVNLLEGKIHSISGGSGVGR